MKLSSNYRSVAVAIAALAVGLVACSKDSATSGDSTTSTSLAGQPGAPSSGGPVTADSTTPQSSATSSTAVVVETQLPTTTTVAPTTTTIAFVTEGGVIKVANASGIDGAAKQTSDRLAALGFATTAATNAAGAEIKLETSKVYVMPGSEPVAFSVAQAMGGIPVAYMPTPVSIKGGPEALGEATIVVMLGADRAGKPTLAG